MPINFVAVNEYTYGAEIQRRAKRAYTQIKEGYIY
jgi:hypothetical protein